MNIQEAIIHRIKKESGQSGDGSTSIDERKTLLPIDELTQKAAEDIRVIYNKVSNSFGTFNSDTINYPFPAQLQNYAVAASLDFIEFTVNVVTTIATKMRGEPFATGGYALFVRYTSNGQDWLLIAMLKLKPGTGIDEATMSLKETLNLDIDHLHEAARIDLTKWAAGTQPYLSFIKRGQGKHDVSLYFREALGCTEYTDSKHHTSLALEAVERFCDDQQLTADQRKDVRRKTYDYLEERRATDEPANIETMSAVIFGQEPRAFVDFVREKDMEINETFQPNRSVYIRLHRIKGKTGHVSVSFDVDDLNQGRVEYIQAENSLLIRNIPAQMASEIIRHQPDANDNPAN